MTEEELGKLKRDQLVAIVLRQEQLLDLMRERLARKADEDEALQEKLSQVESCGSIAEAAIRMTSFLQEAQRAVDIYRVAAERRYTELESKCSERETKARSEADRIITNANVSAVETIAAAQERARLIEETAKSNADELLREAQTKAEQLIASTDKRVEDTLRIASERAAKMLDSAETILNAAEEDSKDIRDAAVRFFISKDQK